MQSETRTYRTGSEEVVLDLTPDAVEFVADRGDGLLQVFVPHATAGIAVIETGAGSDDDLLASLRDLLPRDDRWRHRHGSAGHGRSHVMPAIVPPHCTVPVSMTAMPAVACGTNTWSSPSPRPATNSTASCVRSRTTSSLPVR